MKSGACKNSLNSALSDSNTDKTLKEFDKNQNLTGFEKKSLLFLTIFITGLAGCKNEPTSVEQQGVYIAPAPMLTYGLEKTYPHDTTSFTEGLLFHNGKLYESTGSPESLPETKSVFGDVDLGTGKIEVKGEIDRKLFGEGITFLNNSIYQLTYQSQTGFIYNASTFKKTGEFKFPSAEGWGMTTDSVSLIMSDGTASLTWLDPTNFKVNKIVNVTENGQPVANLNELEYVRGFIYANVFMTNTVVKIDPNSGKIVARLDLFALADDARKINPEISEMNGIAWNPETNRLLITGKFWPKIYQISVE